MPTFLSWLLSRPERSGESIVVVSGLPRSGTSMMQKMLEAGGITPLEDHIRLPDENNPNGYYEFERVKALKDGDTAWLAEAPGKCVKVISALLQYLPPQYDYKVLFMQRNLDEVLASQKKMLVDRGEPSEAVSDEEMMRLYQKHLLQVSAWLEAQRNFSVLNVYYNPLLADPTPQVEAVNRFLGGNLQGEEMVKVIDRQLYHQQRSRPAESS
jgi:hypothetical protein